MDLVASRRLFGVRSVLDHSVMRREFVVGLAVLLPVGVLGFADGGYFPVSWGWTAVGLLWLAAIVLALSIDVEVSTRELVFLGALGALTAWVGLSTLWTTSVPDTVLELERTLVYLSAAFVGVLLLRRRSVPILLAGVWAAIVVVSAYGLCTRLFPNQLGVYDPIEGNRLSQPLGYGNAFGIFAAMGVLLALGLAARSGPVVRTIAGSSTVFLLLALYFTFSRGGWGALFLGLATAVAVDRRRLQLIATALILLPWSVAAIWIASTSAALTHQGQTTAAAARDGHSLAAIALLLAIAAALSMIALDWLEASVHPPELLRRFFAGTLIFVLAASLIVVFGRYGSPPTLARKAYHAFNAPPPVNLQDLNQRLFQLSGNWRREEFHTAWQEAKTHPIIGGGAGSYSVYWFRHRRITFTLHDAHSLYLETLAELGAVGLGLLILAMALPLTTLRRARSSPFAATACAAYVAYVAHAGLDWDWEMPAVTLAALFCGIGMLSLGRGDGSPVPVRPRARWPALGATAILIAFSLLALLGNSAVSASSKSTTAGHYARAESEARRATHLAPWSAEPWRRLGEAQLAAGKDAAARESFRRAVAKDRNDWTLWFELASASSGAEWRRALAAASRLNPRSPEIAEMRAQRAARG